MGEQAGWIKQHRKELESAVFQTKDPYILKVWQWCKLRANFSILTFEGVLIQPGEFVTGRVSGAAECRMSESSFWRKLKKLQNWGNIDLKSNSQFTVVTLCNWKIYNDKENESGQQVDSGRTAGGQRADTREECKECKEEQETHKGSRKRPCVRDYSSDFEIFWALYPKVGKVKKPTAWGAWKKAVERAEPQIIIDAAADFAASDTGLSQFAGHASTWLNGDRWTEDPESWKRIEGEKNEPDTKPLLPYADDLPA